MKTENVKRYLIAALLLAGCAKNQLSDAPKTAAIANTPLANTLLSVPGDVVGKVAVGYQGWFTCANDGSPTTDLWWHWTNDFHYPTGAVSQNKAWPDTREYTTLFKTGLPNLGNGLPATLFSSYSDQTVDTHFKWMQQNGIDVAALQRFADYVEIRDGITLKVKNAAEAHNVKFYIMYDISGRDAFQTELKADWTNKMAAYTSSKAYARQNGKPVVCIWGLGFADRTMTPAAELDVVNWFKSQGCYVIGGVPHEWRDYTKAGDKNFDPVFKALNMISPWMIGAIGDAAASDYYYTNVNMPDVAYCKANGIDYQPCVEPGDLQAGQRKHGDFMWHQFYNMIRVGAQGLYISMFDEYGEGNQIAKTAEDKFMLPAGSPIPGLDEDGVHCSSDYYLRLTGDGGKMLKGLIPLTALRPTEPVIGSGAAHLPPINQAVKIRGDNQKFVGGENGTGPMYCNVVNPQTWETFTVIDAGNGKVALKSMGKYVSSEDGNAPMTCNRTTIGAWETFDYIVNSDVTVSFRGSNGKYVSQEDGTKPMICDRVVAGIWEKFVIN